MSLDWRFEQTAVPMKWKMEFQSHTQSYYNILRYRESPSKDNEDVVDSNSAARVGWMYARDDANSNKDGCDGSHYDGEGKHPISGDKR
jgi:hypothetical protein